MNDPLVNRIYLAITRNNPEIDLDTKFEMAKDVADELRSLPSLPYEWLRTKSELVTR